ncbi:MAG TPA: hypothetical protein P5279_06665 [Anaerohalosphaeraceae bacterium]|nr:hypothetical protein [Anaerohalosphaeraceae bacterium]HRT50156.1 hypothetical protein [Anaerohalosphaeraceae bacterium]HRT88297.1 hypothetical protein [Anaerohalosphaeraceae bacterium]
MEEIPERYRETYKKAMSGKSKAAALKAKCLDCTCWQKDEIRKCTVSDCPLYPYRPYGAKKTTTVKGLARDRQKNVLRDGSGKIMRQNVNESVLAEYRRAQADRHVAGSAVGENQ